MWMLPKFQTPFRGLLLVGFNISSAKVEPPSTSRQILGFEIPANG